MSATFLADRYKQSPFTDACQFSIMQLPAKHENKKVKLTYERKKKDDEKLGLSTRLSLGENVWHVHHSGSLLCTH